MSASPSGNPNGVPKKPGANPMRPMRKRPRTANPLVSSSRRPGVKLGRASGTSQAAVQVPAPDASTLSSLEERRRQYGGWSGPPPPYECTDIPLVTTKKALLDGMHYHLMKFYQAKIDDPPVDPTDQKEFARPVTLQRRDARQPPPGRAVKEEEVPEPPPVDDAEKERLAKIKADREAQRAIDQAKIAPVIKDTAPKKPKKQKEERTKFNRGPKTEAAKKELDTRYVESLPWHLEDADGKNVWVGSYQAALSESNVAFLIDGNVFRMIPLEKWYKFTAKPPFQAYTLDQAEAMMNRKVDVGRWIMKDDEKNAGKQDLEATRRMFYGTTRMVKKESDTFRAVSRLEKEDVDDMDISADEFQDDDEAPMFERNDDPDEKESKERIRREQLGANLFGEGDEQEVEKELKERLREELERQKYGKTTKKALIKRDRENQYESDDSEDNPWSSSSEDSSSDEDEDKEGDKKDGEGKNGQSADKEKGKATGSQGNTTPQGKQKQSELGKKGKSLKRAGSPALSESSGNESSRKKIKKTGTPARGSRAGTPLAHSLASRKSKIGAGSGSDGEGTAGEMSDGAGARKKIKLVGSSRATPNVSRAGSPNPTPGNASPNSQAGFAVIESSEILDKIPPEGISLSDLIKKFSGRVGDKPGQMPRTDWIRLVKQVCDYGQDKRLRRRK